MYIYDRVCINIYIYIYYSGGAVLSSGQADRPNVEGAL